MAVKILDTHSVHSEDSDQTESLGLYMSCLGAKTKQLKLSYILTFE